MSPGASNGCEWFTGASLEGGSLEGSAAEMPLIWGAGQAPCDDVAGKNLGKGFRGRPWDPNGIQNGRDLRHQETGELQ